MRKKKQITVSYAELARACHARVKDAVLSRKLVRASEFECVDCGVPAHCYDHRDYRKPLDVEPVCTKCNQKRGPALPEAEYATVDWLTKQPTGKTKGFSVMLTESQFSFLTRQSIKESVRTGQHISRADWLRKRIDTAMAREKR